MAHLAVIIDTTPEQHKLLVRAMEARKYPYDKKMKGYNSVHVSEIRAYNLRVKKEVLPLVVRDLGGFNLSSSLIDGLLIAIDRDKKVTFLKRFYAKTAVKLLQKTLLLLNIYPAPIAEGEKNQFVTGWYYPYVIGMTNDRDCGYGEEL